MMGILTPSRPNTTSLFAALPLAAMLAGCAPSSTPFGTMPQTAAAEITTHHEMVADQPITRAADRRTVRFQTTPPVELGQRRVQPTAHRPAQPPVAYAGARGDDYALRHHSYPRNARTMTMTQQNPKTTTAVQRRSHGKVEHVGTDRFQLDVLNANVPVLVDFYADWCGPCRMLAPVLDQVARETPHAKVVKVNIDTNPQIAQAYGVSSIPTVMVFRKGSVVAQHTGLADRSTLQRLLSR